MGDSARSAIAVVGIGAIMPDAPDAKAFWGNIRGGRYSITDVSPERWDASLYYDADPKTPDRSYSKIGGWVRKAPWDPMAWKLAIPPKVVEAMDEGQRWAVAATREALLDYGHPTRPLDLERTAVILGNAMGGEKHYRTALRISLPEYAAWLDEGVSFRGLPSSVRAAILRELGERVAGALPPINEDTMPGELSNCIAGRIANVFNTHGANFTCDAACASALAAISAAREGLIEGEFDAVITGGIDRNMGAATFVKFCKIGALSATGTRPFADGADGFVMGEGAALFILKRLADAEKNGDKIYAVLRGMAGSSDGKGKGITAPNPVGQRLAIERAWKNAGVAPAEGMLVEGHGTSTKVGDVVEVGSLVEVLGAGLRPRSVALGSVKSNIGHLKGAAGAAGLFKAVMALHEKVLPPSLNFERPNPNIEWERSPFAVNTELRAWDAPADGVRKAAVSAFGFGGTNFHVVLEEHVPGRFARLAQGRGMDTSAGGMSAVSAGAHGGMSGVSAGAHGGVSAVSAGAHATGSGGGAAGGAGGAPPRAPLRGALVLGAHTEEELAARVDAALREAERGEAPARAAPLRADLDAHERVAIDYGDAAELAEKLAKAHKALSSQRATAWKALRARGIFRGTGLAPKVAFLCTGQGSQYANMLTDLRDEPVVRDLFEEADRAMAPKLGKPLSEFIFVDPSDKARVAAAEEALKQTQITQPAVLAVDTAMARMLGTFGALPDFVMGHSLGEYGALVCAGAMPFVDALEAVAARGKEMAAVSLDDNGKMAAVMGPIATIEHVLSKVSGYVVIANYNSNTQVVIGGSSAGVDEAVKALGDAGLQVVPLQVSHAFHTKIVAPASGPLRKVLERLRLEAPKIPVIANVDGELYPTGPDAREKMLGILARQVAEPVQFVQGLRRLYAQGARVFVEVGPKRALHGFAEDVLGAHDDVLTLSTNHPKHGDVISLNHALCGLYARGVGAGRVPATRAQDTARTYELAPVERAAAHSDERPYLELGRMMVDFLDKSAWRADGARAGVDVCVTGAALGLPGTPRVFEEDAVARLLRGEQLIDQIPSRWRKAMLDKHVVRLVKKEGSDPVFEAIDSEADVIKLAGRAGAFDLAAEYGVPEDRIGALDQTTKMAFAVGIDALRDAGIPLVLRMKTTSRGTQLPDGWALPESMRDDTGIVFACAFPGYDNLMTQMHAYYEDRARRARLAELESLRARTGPNDAATPELDRRVAELRAEIDAKPFQFDRRFLFQVLSMGHSQFAEYIRARGPNTSVNAACASTTQAVTIAQDWIAQGRCRRVIVIAADDITSDAMIGWFLAGFLATGAAATDSVVEEAATPFDRRRHGMLVGMGAAALVVEERAAAKERGIAPIADLLQTEVANSAFHGTRLDVDHITHVMEALVSKAERRWGVDRARIASEMVFVSHETYTPARGGSASAEVHALRAVFGAAAERIVIANTKGYTGHPMGAGIEDVLAVKALETGVVPPVPNFKEVDPELGVLNLSKGGSYPIEYALRLGAGFGSQISMTLLRRATSGPRTGVHALGFQSRVADRAAWDAWLAKASGQAKPELEVVQRTLRVKDSRALAPRAHGSNGAHASSPPPPPKPAPALTSTPALALTATPTPTPTLTPTLTPAPAPAHALTPAPAHALTPALTPAPALALAPASTDAVAERVLALVADKTGYPRDMLALDLDLEADLGVDTVKQAEVFASIREAYSIPRDEKLKLRDYPTLAHVIDFVRTKRPDLASIPPAASATPATMTSPALAAPAPRTGAVDEVAERVLALVSEKTGYPSDMLALDLDLEADLGVDTVKQAEVFAAIREAYSIPRDEKLKLRDYPTLAHVIDFVRTRRPDLAPAAPDLAPAAPAATPATVAAPAAPSARATGDGDHDAIVARILAIVAEKTGYPSDMLALDLDLEADLGVDTVKQAEVFASIREAWSIPRDEKLKLRDYPTLGHVVRFVEERRPKAAAPETLAAPEATAPDTAHTPAWPRRVPVPSLRPDIGFCKRTAVKIERGARVVVVGDAGGVADELAARLGERGAEVLRADDLTMADAAARATSFGDVHGVFWLRTLDVEPPIATLDAATFASLADARAKAASALARALYDRLGAGAFFIAGARMGGMHGYDAAGARSALGGAISGFVKALRREREGLLAKCVDFELDAPCERVAEALIEEALRDPGVVEVGRARGRRWTVALEARDASATGLTLGPSTVYVVTGAAGSITSAITTDLARTGGTFWLLDLTPAPGDEPDLDRLTTDRDALKRDLFERAKARGARATPATVERELAGLERRAAARDAVRAIEASGGRVLWRSCDLRDEAAVAAVVAEIRAAHGRVDVLVHAAGLEISRGLPDKKPEEFDLVWDVKCKGAHNLLRALGDAPVGAVVAFSSIAGRFGNAGQTDYSSANDFLCKLLSGFASVRPSTRGIAIDWTAWAEIGMASRGSIPVLMELAGIDMLPPAIGVPIVRRELERGDAREIVAAGALGILMEELDDQGGVDPAAFAGRALPMLGAVVRAGTHEGLVVRAKLDPARQGFLADHRIDGVPVLPGVMGIEAFAEIATLLAPDWTVAAIEDVEFLAPFKFYRGEPREVTLEARVIPDDGALVARCRLLGTRTLAGGAEETKVHFTADVRLAPASAEPAPRPPTGWTPLVDVGAEDIYRVYFHGPAYRVIAKAWRDGNTATAEVAQNLPPNHTPAELPTLMAPRLIESCFQAAGLWDLGTSGRMGLPQHVDRVTTYRAVDLTNGGRLFVVATPTERGYDADVVDADGRVYVSVSGYRTAELPAPMDAKLLGPLVRAMG